jgi:hypothetical protein
MRDGGCENADMLAAKAFEMDRDNRRRGIEPACVLL